MKKVAIIMGSDSDLPVLKPAVKTLEKFGIQWEIHVISAHRTPDAAAQFSKSARENGFGAIIAAAGKAAHLAGVLAAYTTLPVIGIPVKSSMEGLDSLLSTVQMPPGVPVAAMAIDGGQNAALFAAEIFAVEDKVLADKLAAYKDEMKKKVMEKDMKIAQEVLQ